MAEKSADREARRGPLPVDPAASRIRHPIALEHVRRGVPPGSSWKQFGAAGRIWVVTCGDRVVQLRSGSSARGLMRGLRHVFVPA